jgi:hypothetical protein
VVLFNDLDHIATLIRYAVLSTDSGESGLYKDWFAEVRPLVIGVKAMKYRKFK